LILVAGRSSEVRFATWQEIDLGEKVWTIPASRMKAGLGHRVPLADRVIEILKQVPQPHSGLVFPGRAAERPLSSITLRKLLPGGVTLHGMRSSFRDWCGEETAFSREVAEAALAHVIGSAVERSYRRGDALEKRRALMQAWANFCESPAESNVVSISKLR
jgi:integrase